MSILQVIKVNRTLVNNIHQTITIDILEIALNFCIVPRLGKRNAYAGCTKSRSDILTQSMTGRGTKRKLLRSPINFNRVSKPFITFSIRKSRLIIKGITIHINPVRNTISIQVGQCNISAAVIMTITIVNTTIKSQNSCISSTSYGKTIHRTTTTNHWDFSCKQTANTFKEILNIVFNTIMFLVFFIQRTFKIMIIQFMRGENIPLAVYMRNTL